MQTGIGTGKASEQLCNYVDALISTWNPCPPDNEVWTKPGVHPCRKQHKDISDSNSDENYIDLLNTVQRHTHCSTKYCLKYKQDKKDMVCRFKYPFDRCNKTRLVFEPVHTKDNSEQYKATIVTRRNDARLNNHQRIQLTMDQIRSKKSYEENHDQNSWRKGLQCTRNNALIVITKTL